MSSTCNNSNYNCVDQIQIPIFSYHIFKIIHLTRVFPKYLSNIQILTKVLEFNMGITSEWPYFCSTFILLIKGNSLYCFLQRCANQQLSQNFKMCLKCSPNLPLHFSGSWQTGRKSTSEVVSSPIFSRIKLCPRFSLAFWLRSLEFYPQLCQKMNNLSQVTFLIWASVFSHK